MLAHHGRPFDRITVICDAAVVLSSTLTCLKAGTVLIKQVSPFLHEKLQGTVLFKKKKPYHHEYVLVREPCCCFCRIPGFLFVEQDT